MDPLLSSIEDLEQIILNQYIEDDIDLLYQTIDRSQKTAFLDKLAEIPIYKLKMLIFTPILYAIQENNIEMLKFLIEIKNNPKDKKQKLISKEQDGAEMKLAIQQSNFEIVDILIENEFQNFDSLDGKTSLIQSSIFGNVKMAKKFLFQMGQKDNFGYSALHYSIVYDYQEVVKILEQEQDIETEEGVLPEQLSYQMKRSNFT